MHAKQIQKCRPMKPQLDLSLIPIERVPQPSLWERIKKSFCSSDFSREQWEKIEMKRSRSSFAPDQRRNF